jgi:RNA polymerase-interacting CarD/CdnL/TRCF family regulator
MGLTFFSSVAERIGEEAGMQFKAGDRVVHPRHGVGRVVKLAIKNFDPGRKRPYYEISIADSTVWIPYSQSDSGLRKLTAKKKLATCRKVLKTAPAPLDGDPRQRLHMLSEHLKEGTIKAHCEVVRDLSAFGWQNTLSGAMASFLQVTREVLDQEWAAVDGVSQEEAAEEIDSLLEQCKRAHYPE